MTFSFIQVALIFLLYLTVLFALAQATEKGLVPRRVVSHPLVYIFSLGIFASAWSFYGVIDLAKDFGYGALAYYLGTGALFVFAPLALKPLIELARRFQINSMADLLTFRYHSHTVGGLVTLCMLLAMAPLLALQIQAVAETAHIMTNFNTIGSSEDSSSFTSRNTLALAYCVVVGLFAAVFGSNREHHNGLIIVMAFESLIKIFGLCAIGFFAIFFVFGSPGELDTWLAANPKLLDDLYSPVANSSTHTLLLVFIATAVSMPHIFHMTVVENPEKHMTNTVTWAFPLFLFFMALPIFPILWAGQKLDTQISAEYFPLIIPMAKDSATFTIISFVAGISAATGAIISIALAVSTMIMNHWILPTIPLGSKKELYGQLIKIRRILIIVVVVGGYVFYLSLRSQFNLTDLALAAFIATLQFLPGIIAVVHWSKGNRKGFIAGLFIGISIWFMFLFVPMLIGIPDASVELSFFTINFGIENWNDITLWSLGINTISFIVVSLQTQQTADEIYSAELCSEDELSHPIRMTLDIRSPTEIVERLGARIGKSTAQVEVDRALQKLNLNPNERRPYALRRLRDEIEANLSGLLGISMASEIMDKQIPLLVPELDSATDITLIESRLGQYRDHLSGLAEDLNNLRLYHRRTLESLPIALCSIGKDTEVLMWNSAMEELTGIDSESVTGSNLQDVLYPWGKLLFEFSTTVDKHFYNQSVQLADSTHWISLHKSEIPTSFANKVDGQVILVEDVTEMQVLEKELIHSERLASVGRLAAGVAHEIGNPVTGIACLAQNLEFETDPQDISETAHQILSQTDRVSRIVQSLVSFSHTGSHDGNINEPINLYECAQEAINLLKLQKEKGEIHFVNELPENLILRGDSQRLIQVFVNLLSNARDASPEGTKVEVAGHQTGKFATVSITDEGPGIPEEIQERVFEPFFTTKEPGEGTGLGLAMVYSIVDDHDGSLEIVTPVDVESQTGTRFVIKLPIKLESERISGNTIG